MNITLSENGHNEITQDALIVPVFQDEAPASNALLFSLNGLTGGNISAVYSTAEFSGKKGERVLLHCARNNLFKRVVLVGLGPANAAGPDVLQQAAGGAIRLLSTCGIKSVAISLPDQVDHQVAVTSFVEGAIVANEPADIYRSKERRERLDEFAIVRSGSSPDLERHIAFGRISGEATNLARTLGNEPSNVMTPAAMAMRALEMAEAEGLSCEIIEQDELKSRGFGSLLAVASGSKEPARLIVLSYEHEDLQGKEDVKTTAFVGKGITFDSGGISIKPAAKMDEMKFDMCGGAAVIGAMQAIARLKPRARILGLVPAAENLPSGRSFRPGDVIKSLSGKTIEVTNTDAEGRLILCDAITFAIERGAGCVIDVATLTGACVVALGEIRAGIMGNYRSLVDRLLTCGNKSGEKLWELPGDAEYAETLRSPIADMKNDARGPGAIVAGMFLKEFAGSTPWAHLDIAGTAWTDRDQPHISSGATGFGVKTLINFAMESGQ